MSMLSGIHTKKATFKLSTLVSALILSLVLGGTVKAAPTGGVLVTPISSTVALSSGSSETVAITVKNLYNKTYDIQNSIDDIVVKAGGQEFLLDGQNAPSHGLRQYISPIEQFSLAPNASKKVFVKVTVPQTLASGVYYATVLFRPSLNSNISNEVSSVGSVITAKVTHRTEQIPQVQGWSIEKWALLAAIALLVIIEGVLVRLLVVRRRSV